MTALQKAFPKIFKKGQEPAKTCSPSKAKLLSFSTSTSSNITTVSPTSSSPFPSPPSYSSSEDHGKLSRSLPTTNRHEEAADSSGITRTHTHNLHRANSEVMRNSTKPLKKEVTALAQQLHNSLLQELQTKLGHARALALYTTHIKRSKYLLVYGDEPRDAALAQDLRRVLEEEGQVVEGPWSISAGELRMETWQRLSSRAVAVVVMLSPALFQNLVLCRCLAEMQYSHPDTIVPLFLEPSSPRCLPPDLTFLSRTGGRIVPMSHWDPHPFAKSLVGSCKRFKHFCREIRVLNSLLDSLRDNPDYVCPCGRC